MEDWEKMLKCPRCKKRFVDPKIVCCQRTCCECLQKMIDNKAKNGVLFCKICNRAVLIPDTSKPKRTWARQFPADHFLENLKDAVCQLEGKRLCYVCDSRKQVSDARVFCFECDTYFCHTCEEAHRHMPKMHNHKMVQLDVLTPVELMRNRKRSCKTHTNKSLELFCKDCNQAICAECASSTHQKCANVSSLANVAEEKKRMLKSAEKTIREGIEKCEESSQRLKSEGAEIAEIKKQTVEEIDGAFHAVSDALSQRKKKLMKDISTHFNKDIPQFNDLAKRMEKIKGAMKANTEFIAELVNNASDIDLIENADRIRHQTDIMLQQNAEVAETPKPKMLVKMDDLSVKNFVELVSLLGAEVGSTQVKGILVKKMTTKMSGDKAIPDIRDIVVMDSGALLAIDNKNSCVKGIIFKGDQFSVQRLALKSQPWGGAKLQDNMIAVTGLKVFYIISLTEELTLHNTVHTRKDYWGICALSPINLACSCKYPPCVDIVDITGRRLRTIDQDQYGNQLFEMPGYLGNLGGRIVVSDRCKKALICVDQLGQVVFTYTGEVWTYWKGNGYMGKNQHLYQR
ncbi:tripartite motif-containing protein 56 [Plakobranchus ocellatus]|uniref:Tripartite motif-containing protein 56 n=1 Tax=Plakobranchus ocellatus TaxID=259542 RepID=A0AAV4AF33_9GAST|nr:tripartite motif-containing protein 56 [Plakobranchus ocellatus]